LLAARSASTRRSASAATDRTASLDSAEAEAEAEEAEEGVQYTGPAVRCLARFSGVDSTYMSGLMI
jgi:hypothetical protein